MCYYLGTERKKEVCEHMAGYCDQCENHCPLNALRCGRGRRMYGNMNEGNDIPEQDDRGAGRGPRGGRRHDRAEGRDPELRGHGSEEFHSEEAYDGHGDSPENQRHRGRGDHDWDDCGRHGGDDFGGHHRHDDRDWNGRDGHHGHGNDDFDGHHGRGDHDFDGHHGHHGCGDHDGDDCDGHHGHGGDCEGRHGRGDGDFDGHHGHHGRSDDHCEGHGHHGPTAADLTRRMESGNLTEMMEMCGHMLHHRPEVASARGQGRILMILAELGQISQRQLQEMLRIQPGSMSEILSKLERKGLLTRERGEDRRGNLLRITDAGRAAVTETAPLPEDTLFNALSAEQQDDLRSLLKLLLTDWIARFGRSPKPRGEASPQASPEESTDSNR